MTTFNVKTHGLRDLEKFYRRAPRKFARASANMTNSLAFETRRAAIVQIAGDMTIRGDRFVNSRMRVDKARAGPISSQRAEVGSVPTSRFSGWIEQETGAAPLRNRVFNIAARRGNEQNVATARARLKPSNRFRTVDDFDLSGSNRIAAFITIMARKHPNEGFVIRKRYKRMRRGIYSVTKRGQLKQLQSFNAMRVRRKPWMAPARKRVVTRANVRKQWARAIERVL